MKRPSPALVLSGLALFVSLTGFGVAATGGNFILGSSNTADKQTALTGPINGNPVLRAENAGTAAASYGVVGKITSAAANADSAGVKGLSASTNPSAAAVLGKNTGGGPGLSSIVNSGVPPLSVNSSTKVDNLNADQLDGVDSTGFYQPGHPLTLGTILQFPQGLPTPSVAGGSFFLTNSSSPGPGTTITGFMDPSEGQIIFVACGFGDATRIADGPEIHLAGHADFLCPLQNVLELVYTSSLVGFSGPGWFELGRS